MTSHAKFAYNRFPNRTIQKSSFEIVHGMSLTNCVDLIPIPHTGQVRVDVGDLV